MAKKHKKPAYFSFFQTWGMLIGIFVLALIFRLYHLGTTPAGFHVDEVNVGYVGRYLLTHGKDIFGNTLPSFFNKFGDYRPIGIFYLSGFSTFLFGVNEFAVRFPSAFIGALTVIPMYLFAAFVSGRRSVGFVAAFFLAIAPWHIVISRATSESIVGLFLVLLGLWFLFQAGEKKKPRFIMYGALCLLGSYIFYHTFRVLVPLLLPPFLFWQMQNKVKKYMRFLVVGSFAITILFSLTSAGSGRLQQVAFYKNPDFAKKMEAQLAGDAGVPLFISRVFHNKAAQYGREFVNQYISYYSVPYLFFSGGYPDRYRVPEQGLLYFIFAPFMFIGLATLFIDRDRRHIKWYMLYFLGIATLPAALTYEDSPNVQRSLPLLIPLILFTAHGCSVVWKRIDSHVLLRTGGLIVFMAILLYEVAAFTHQYAVHADQHRSLYRNDGNRELFVRIEKQYDSVDYIVMPLAGEFPMYAAFYTQIFNFFPSSVYDIQSPLESRLGKFIFVPTTCPGITLEKRPEGRGIYIDYAECVGGASGLVEQKVVTRSDNTRAYRFYTTGE